MGNQDMLIRAVELYGGLSGVKAKQVVKVIFKEITAALVRGDEVIIRKFGSFSVRDKAERMGRNPKTNEPAKVSARRVVRFRSSKFFRASVSAGGEPGLDHASD